MVGLHRLLKVLCVLLVVFTYLLVYVIQNAIITPSAVLIRNSNTVKYQRTQQQKKEEIVGSSLQTLFRNLNSTRCSSSSFKSHPFSKTTSTKAGNGSSSSGGGDEQFWRPVGGKSSTILHSAFMDARTEFQNVKYRFVRVLGLRQGRRQQSRNSKYSILFELLENAFFPANFRLN